MWVMWGPGFGALTAAIFPPICTVRCDTIRCDFAFLKRAPTACYVHNKFQKHSHKLTGTFTPQYLKGHLLVALPLRCTTTVQGEEREEDEDKEEEEEKEARTK